VSDNEEWKVPIYRFFQEADKEGPLKAWKKFAQLSETILTSLDSMSWFYYWMWKLLKGNFSVPYRS